MMPGSRQGLVFWQGGVSVATDYLVGSDVSLVRDWGCFFLGLRQKMTFARETGKQSAFRSLRAALGRQTDRASERVKGPAMKIWGREDD